MLLLLLCWLALAAGLAVTALLTGGWTRLISPLRWQSDRGLQIESLWATPLMLIRGFAPEAAFSPTVHDTVKGSVAHVRPPADAVRAFQHDNFRARRFEQGGCMKPRKPCPDDLPEGQHGIGRVAQLPAGQHHEGEGSTAEDGKEGGAGQRGRAWLQRDQNTNEPDANRRPPPPADFLTQKER